MLTWGKNVIEYRRSRRCRITCKTVRRNSCDLVDKKGKREVKLFSI